MSRFVVSSPCAVIFLAVATFYSVSASAADDPEGTKKRGLAHREHDVAPGYTLISPFSSKSTFRIGDVRFGAAEEHVGQWDRVHVDLTDSEVKVTFGGSRQVAARSKDTTPRLTFVNDGVATEICNVYVRAE